MTAPLHLHGTTVHARRGALSHAFSHRVDYVLIDPDETRGPRLFSRNRVNLASVADRDHGGVRGTGRGAVWAHEVLARHGLATGADSRLLLLTQPRFLGYVFNPVSFWLRFEGDALVAVIAEVNNTFGDRHSYLCALPGFAPPAASLSDIGMLVPGALAIAMVGLLEAISIGRAFAVRRRESFDANQEMVGQGLSNAFGGLFQCYAGSGSFTRSGVNAEAGARTPLAAIFSSLFLAVILVLFSDLIRFSPVPAMAGLILYVAFRLIDVQELRRVIRVSRPETVILGATLLAGLLVELDFAIYVGVIASFAVFIYESSHPSIVVSAPVVTASGRRKFRNVDLHGNPECPQIVTVRLDGPLYFGSAEHVARAFDGMRRRHSGQKIVLFYLKGSGKIDLAGADFLIHAIREVREDGGSFHMIALFRPLVASLRQLHVIEELGEENLHISKGEALAAALREIDTGICASCSKRVFLECEGLPGPAKTGMPQQSKPVVAGN